MNVLRPSLRARLAAPLSLVVALGASAAHAQPSAEGAAAAEALYQEGKQLLAAGKLAEACSKLEGSQRLDPAIGTQLYLAECYERLGKSASAWVTFLEAASAAKKAGDTKREELARSRAAALEASLARARIEVPDESRVPGLALKRDGAPVDAALWNAATPVDPGQHVIEATAPGRRAWRGTLDVRAGGTATLRVPPLEQAPAEAPPPPPKPTAAPPAAPPPPPPAPASSPKETGPDGSAQRTWALVAGGVGVVGLGVGTVLALSAQSTWDDAQAACPARPCPDDRGRDLSRDALDKATFATVAFGIGGAALVGGAVLWLTAPSPSGTASAPARAGIAARPSAGPGLAGLVIDGRF